MTRPSSFVVGGYEVEEERRSNVASKGRKSMPLLFLGGCLCGAVRYECSGPPSNVVHCFCKDCQRSTGTQMSTNLLVPSGSVRLTKGRPTQYSKPGDSGKQATRYFCSNCGSILWSQGEAVPDLRILKVGTLDDSSWVIPRVSIYTDSAPEWSTLPVGLANFAKTLPPVD